MSLISDSADVIPLADLSLVRMSHKHWQSNRVMMPRVARIQYVSIGLTHGLSDVRRTQDTCLHVKGL